MKHARSVFNLQRHRLAYGVQLAIAQALGYYRPKYDLDLSRIGA